MKAKEFANQYRQPKRFRTNAGKRMHKVYGAVYDDNGRIDLVEKGEESIYDFIQSFADSVDIHVIMKRFERGEADVLSKVQGFYGDYTGMPDNYAEVLNVVQKGEDFFNELPVEERAKFGHSFNEFMTSLSDGTLFEKMGYKADPSPSGGDPSPSGGDPSPSGGNPAHSGE